MTIVPGCYYYLKETKDIIFSEINRCLQNGCFFITTMALLSYTEFLGKIAANKSSATDNFKIGLSYFSFNGNQNYYKDFQFSVDGKKRSIYDVFRCGCVHEFSPKIGNFIIFCPKTANLYIPPSDAGITWDGKSIHFNCPAYFRDFQQAFENYLIKLEKDSSLQSIAEKFKKSHLEPIAKP